MKPLDLVIYEKHPGTEGAAGPVYRVGGSFAPYCIVAKDKRFTDAELAATYFMVHSTVMQFLGYKDKRGSATDLKARDAQRRLKIIERFATLPHYDEETS